MQLFHFSSILIYLFFGKGQSGLYFGSKEGGKEQESIQSSIKPREEEELLLVLFRCKFLLWAKIACVYQWLYFEVCGLITLSNKATRMGYAPFQRPNFSFVHRMEFKYRC